MLEVVGGGDDAGWVIVSSFFEYACKILLPRVECGASETELDAVAGGRCRRRLARAAAEGFFEFSNER